MNECCAVIIEPGVQADPLAPAPNTEIIDALKHAAQSANLTCEPQIAPSGAVVFTVPSMNHVFALTLRMRLYVRPTLDLFMGVGWGAADASLKIDDGGWQAAHQALRDVHAEIRHVHETRSLIVQAPHTSPIDLHVFNTLLRLRDHVIGRMKPRDRRITAMSLDGQMQQSIAEKEGISQPAVSQSLARSGGGAFVKIDRSRPRD